MYVHACTLNSNSNFFFPLNNNQTNNQKPRESTLWAWLNSRLFTCVTCLVSITLLPIIHIPGTKELGVEVKQQLSATKTNYSSIVTGLQKAHSNKKTGWLVPASVYNFTCFSFVLFFISFLIAHRCGLIFVISATPDWKKNVDSTIKLRILSLLKLMLVPIKFFLF